MKKDNISKQKVCDVINTYCHVECDDENIMSLVSNIKQRLLKELNLGERK